MFCTACHAGGADGVLYTIKAYWGGSARRYNDVLQTVLLDAGAPPIRWIDGGEEHLVVLQQDGSARVFGDDAQGQQLVPEAAAQPGGCWTVAAGKYHSLCVTPRGGGIIQWGYHPDWTAAERVVPAELQPGAAGRTATIKTVGCGTAHSAALLSNGRLITW
jgi:alpha-tubulin suppressor-like RCC1 family protein